MFAVTMVSDVEFFSIVCTITGVKKIVRYNEYFVIPRFCYRAEDRTKTTYAFASQPQFSISREIHPGEITVKSLQVQPRILR